MPGLPKRANTLEPKALPAKKREYHRLTVGLSVFPTAGLIVSVQLSRLLLLEGWCPALAVTEPEKNRSAPCPIAAERVGR